MKKLITIQILFFILLIVGMTLFCISIAHAENELKKSHFDYNEIQVDKPFKKFALRLGADYSIPYGEYNNLMSGSGYGAEFTYYVTPRTGFKIGWERMGIDYGNESYAATTPPWDIRYRIIFSEKKISPFRINIALHYLHSIGNAINPKARAHLDFGLGHYRMKITSRQSIIDDSTGVVHSNNYDYAKSRIAFEMGGGLILHLINEFALDFGLLLSYNISGRTENIILTPPAEQFTFFYYGSKYPKYDGLMKLQLGLIWFF
ncbi:MAG: hypothetical protein ABIE07_10510 [Candidatus Zixiibacteriota bacterium]